MTRNRFNKYLFVAQKEVEVLGPARVLLKLTCGSRELCESGSLLYTSLSWNLIEDAKPLTNHIAVSNIRSILGPINLLFYESSCFR